MAQRAGNTPDARGVAEAFVGTWNQMAARLVPVVGGTGVHILLSRALQIASKNTPRLLLAGTPEPGATQLDNLRACIEAHDANSAAEASYALLATFTDLLASLIGNDLTDQLLDPAWSSPPDSPQKENTP